MWGSIAGCQQSAKAEITFRGIYKLHHAYTYDSRYICDNDTKWEKSKQNDFFCQIAKLHPTPNEEVRSKINISLIAQHRVISKSKVFFPFYFFSFYPLFHSSNCFANKGTPIKAGNILGGLLHSATRRIRESIRVSTLVTLSKDLASHWGLGPKTNRSIMELHFKLQQETKMVVGAGVESFHQNILMEYSWKFLKLFWGCYFLWPHISSKQRERKNV